VEVIGQDKIRYKEQRYDHCKYPINRTISTRTEGKTIRFGCKTQSMSWRRVSKTVDKN
jgi:hypothetical protein